MSLTPASLSLPAKFTEFRAAQISAIDHGLSAGQRFVPMALPLGSGKSLIAVAIAKLTGLRTVIATATRGLQTQYQTDFPDDLMLIKGRANYQCGFHHQDCRLGQLNDCPLLRECCTYEEQRDQARQFPIVVTNYSYWLHINEFIPGLCEDEQFNSDARPVELLILDEAHQASAELSRYLQTGVRETWLRTAGLRDLPGSIREWREFALNNVVAVSKMVTALQRTHIGDRGSAWLTQITELDNLKRSLASITLMDEADWLMQAETGTQYGRTWTFDNIWPGAQAFRLFRRVPKIILMSGTLRPSHMGWLGVPKDGYEFEEWPRVFPVVNTPVYYVPTVRMNEGVTDEDKEKWVARIDEIIESRLDRKGIIHTVSYKRQQYLHANSRFQRFFYENKASDTESESAASVVTRFKAAAAPAILVSPSFSTGWDFPGRQCEWQIIAKVPYPNYHEPITKARNARWPNYSSQIAMQDLEQACGRGTRSMDDRCEIFIIDDCVKGLLYHPRTKGLKSRWFSVIPMPQVPPPSEKRCLE